MKNNQCIARITIADEIKSSAFTCINNLKILGITPVLLSGDSKINCEELAQKLGIKEVYFEQSPEQKLNVIKKLKLATPIAMVGDGINDAPALNLANVGISLGNATQVAIESAQIVLLRANHLEDIEFALRLSRVSLTTIKQNLFWAFFYNVIAIPIAAIGFLNPLSDVIVVGNSIWLKTKNYSKVQYTYYKILFIPKWYPNRTNKFSGIFIEKHAKALAKECRSNIVCWR
ncbi:MAG: HAD-IC family P-type ATPase [Bacteroidetes bacterium]|nr:HAD-IC family P-type ATPase [Bacteroidota bacterium]